MNGSDTFSLILDCCLLSLCFGRGLAMETSVFKTCIAVFSTGKLTEGFVLH